MKTKTELINEILKNKMMGNLSNNGKIESFDFPEERVILHFINLENRVNNYKFLTLYVNSRVEKYKKV